MKILWLTDIHLNMVSTVVIDNLCNQINQLNADLVMISGDIADAPTFESALTYLSEHIETDIYFVLGNHDFYHSSIEQMRASAISLSDLTPNLHYLTDNKLIPISNKTCLIGHDGWADGRCGDFFASPVILNDYRLIKELTGLDQNDLLKKLNLLGDEAAHYCRTMLEQALKDHRHVVLLTHVPPFQQACWHEGHSSDDDYAPHFSCQALGEALLDVMKQHPDKQLTVYCGHTHGEGSMFALPNFQVITGGAEYLAPTVQAPIYFQ